jgi:hypothetical protein
MSLAGSPFESKSRIPVVLSTRPVGAPKSRFNQFGLEYSRLLSDDYVHKKFLTVKYAGKGKSFIFNGKGTLDFKVGADKREQPATSSEVKFVTNVEGRNIETKFDNRGGIRIWGDFGTYTVGKPISITAKVKTNNAFNYLSGYLSFGYATRGLDLQTRFDLKNGNRPLFNQKLLFNYDRFQIGAVTKFDLVAHTLSRYNLYLSYVERDFSVHAEHTSRNKNKVDLGKLCLGAIYRRAGNDYVLKASYRPYKVQQFRFKVGAVTNLNKDTVLRAKINNNTKLTLSTKFRYNSNLTVVAGTQVNLLEPATFFTNRTIPIPLGLSLEFNYA